MRKITQEAVNAFMNGQSFNKDNTEIRIINRDKYLSSWKQGTKELNNYTSMILHGNLIATRYQYMDGSVSVLITNASWFSNTVKERLNGIPGVSIQQKKGLWYLNGKQWDGKWATI